ncbi:DUF1631 family protein [Microbulbifer taiwanensis]|uniref:DUF1631 family protein n=1 Tax=Microbulbifer taiwanensis TaxID=986746 RepID=UPI0018694CC6|nr:DUF1631 family protein [Microbulbifer taiwanensis]
MDTDEFSRVVAFNSKVEAANRIRPPALPAAVISVRDSASSWLFARMKEVFAGVDDTLFAAAEKVHTQEEQDGLFQALRVLRLERSRLTERFVSGVQRGFVEVDDPARDQAQEPTAAAEGLSLLRNDVLEQQVALQSIIADVKRDCACPIAEMALRLDTLLPLKIYDENMPLSPALLCRALERALAPLDIQLRARLTILKKFEQLLAAKLAALYQSCNQLLIEKGVLPGLKPPLFHPRQGGRPARSPPPPTDGGADGAFLRSGIPAAPSAAALPGAQVRIPDSGGGAAAAGGDYGLLPSLPGVASMATPDLLQHLGALQAVPLQEGGQGRVLDVGHLLQQRLVAAKLGASLHERDTEVIRMVELLFSFMLEDRNLAESIKAQLIRLQLPLLKLAIADKSFFSKGGHPARKLFNALADAAIGWQPAENYQQEAFYCEVRAVVEQVLQEFDSDECVFARLLQSFEEFVARERRRAEVMERRTVDEARGSARVEAARARVAAVFDALTAERKLPRLVHEWLNRVWNGVLFRTCLREGTDGAGWRRNVLTARDLVWSVVAPMPESRFKMQLVLPDLRRRLDEGAQSLSLAAGDRQRLMEGLETLYRERQALGERVESERERRARERLVQELRREADSVMEIPEAPEVAEAGLAAEAAETPALVESVDEAKTLQILDRETDLPAMEELQRVAEKASVAPRAGLAPLADSDEFWRQTYHLKYSWFMLQDADKAPVRCRLAAIIKELDQFMFVNRAGARAAVYSRLELAHALRDEVIKPLDKGPLFERALNYVAGTIGETGLEACVAGRDKAG